MEERHAVKLTVTYSDGSTEDFDVFLATVASGLILSGKDEDGDVLYTAGKDLNTRGIAHITASPEVSVALALTSMRVVERIVDGMPPEAIPSWIEALLSLSSKATELYHVSKTVKLRHG